MKIQSRQFDHQKKLTLEKEQPMDPLFHLFTEIPLTSLERDPDFFSKNLTKNTQPQQPQQPPSLSSSRKFNQNSSMDSFHSLRSRASRNEVSSKLNIFHEKSGKSRGNKIRQMRIDNICRNFVRKLQRNNMYSRPVLEEEVTLRSQSKVLGLVVSQRLKCWWGLFSCLIMLALFLSQSLLLAFTQFEKSTAITAIVSIGIAFIIGELGIGLAQIKYEQGKIVNQLTQIIKIYSKGHLIIDVMVLAMLILMLITNIPILSYLILTLFVLKHSTFQARLRSAQKLICNNAKISKYWRFLKMIFLNMGIAHIIAIILNLMVLVNPSSNWQALKGIENAWWFQRYVWSYYWSVSIMTTVGFGGINPTSYEEAICIIFIEIASCTIFAYNLVILANIIMDKSKETAQSSIRIFQNFSKKKNINGFLKAKIVNYFEEKEELLSNANVLEQKEVIERLPNEYKNQIMNETCKQSLQYLPFFNKLQLKTILEFSRCIQRKMYLPDNTVKGINDALNIYVLEKGEIGYVCHSPLSKLHHLVINSIKIEDNCKPSLLSLDFLTHQRSTLEIKSISCSIVQFLPYQCFKTVLSQFPKNYEHYCCLRDTSRHVIDQYQTVSCQKCHNKHTKATCPKLHFIPIKELVVSKHIKIVSNLTRRARGTSRIMRKKMNTLNISKFCQNEYSKVKAPAKRSYYHENEMMLTPSNSLIDAMKSQWKLSQLSLDNLDWTNTLLSLQFTSQLRAREERLEDEVWLLASDTIQDYELYFPNGNLKSIVSNRNKGRI